MLAATLATRGNNFSMADAVAAPLGIAKTEAGNLRQLAIKGVPDGHHVYATLSDGGFLLGYVDADAARTYRFDARLSLMAAVKAVDNVGYPIPLSEAQSPAMAEAKYWSDIADRLQERK